MAKLNRFACLTYHAIGKNTNQYELSGRQLRAQLALLHEEGYKVEGFEELEAWLRSGLAFPGRYVILTADDGCESVMELADALGEHAFQGTFFLTRDKCLRRPGFICSAQIRELRKRGFSVGTHGTSHRGLTFLPQEGCLAELLESKQWLEDVLGEQVLYMAAPGGFINSRVMKLAYEQGYTLVGTCDEWMNSPGVMVLPCRVNRVNVRRHFSIEAFRRIIEGHPSFYVCRQVRAAGFAIPKRLLARWDGMFRA